MTDNVVDLPGTRARWTTANVDEGLPGTLTPLCWTFYARPVEEATRAAWFGLGAMTSAERPIPRETDGRFFSPMLGHATTNVDLFGTMAERMPGGSAAALEVQLFGSTSSETISDVGPGRYPFVAAKAPATIRRAIRALPPLAVETERWWRETAFGLAAPEVGREHDGDAALTALGDAYYRFVGILNVHLILSMACQGVLERVAKLAAGAGLPGLEHELIRSDEGTAEFELVADLQRFADRELTLEEFLSEHGYHGPGEGLLDAVVWREDASPVESLAVSYRRRGRLESTDELVSRRRAEHADACRRLEGALGPIRWRAASVLIDFAARTPVWRETGRANILRAVDVGRAAARALGTSMARRGELEDAGDVFFFTVQELLSGPSERSRSLLAARRADHDRFARIRLPHVWRGAPVPVPVPIPVPGGAPAPERARRLEGLGVSAGIAEGVVRVIHDQREADLEIGEVLVCRTTDPSWASLFPLAEAVITDVGSSMSHAAIVCRELGIPCVAGTRAGTTRLRDGDRVRVDGSTGVVDVIDTRPKE